MARKKYSTPGRVPVRTVIGINMVGTAVALDMFTADDAVTLQRTIIDISVVSETVSGASQEFSFEIWKDRGQALPAMNSGNLHGVSIYGSNTDLIYRFQGLIMRESTSAGARWHIQKVLKGMRKLKPGQKLVFRVLGGAFVIFGGTIILFCLES